MAKVRLVGEPGSTQLRGLLGCARCRRVLADPGAAGVGGCRVVQEKRLDGVAGGSEAAGDRRGRCATGADECVDLAQVDAGEVGSGQFKAVEEPGRRLPGRDGSGAISLDRLVEPPFTPRVPTR